MLIKPSHIIAITSLVLLGFANNASAKPERTISVMGTALTRAVPDTVVWHITTGAANPSLISAKSESDRKMKSILSTARALGVAPADMQTGYLSVNREYEHGKFTRSRTFKQFRVAREITIKERDISRFDTFLAKLIEASDMEVHYTLESSKLTEFRDQTRLDAVVTARKKANAMAGALGAELGQVLTITERSLQGSHLNATTNTVTWNDNKGSSYEMEANTTTFAPGTIEVKVSVATVFQLR
jgi:uncharacterized protein YggE